MQQETMGVMTKATQSHTYAHTHMHAHLHTHTYTHTHTHTYTHDKATNGKVPAHLPLQKWDAAEVAAREHKEIGQIGEG